MKKTLLISETELKNISVIEQNVDSKILSKIIYNIQETQLNSILGDTLFNQIIDEVYTAATGGTALPDATKTLLDSYIIPFLSYATLADFTALNNYKIGNKGTLKLNDNAGQSVQSNEVEYLKNYYDNYKAQYKKKLIEFLETNKLSVTGTDKNITSDGIGWYLP